MELFASSGRYSEAQQTTPPDPTPIPRPSSTGNEAIASFPGFALFLISMGWSLPSDSIREIEDLQEGLFFLY